MDHNSCQGRRRTKHCENSGASSCSVVSRAECDSRNNATLARSAAPAARGSPPTHSGSCLELESVRVKKLIFFPAFQTRECDSLRNGRYRAAPAVSRGQVVAGPAVVPGRGRGPQHDPRGPAWRYDRPRARTADTARSAHMRFEADSLVNGIPYSKTGYRGSARLFSIEVPYLSAVNQN